VVDICWFSRVGSFVIRKRLNIKGRDLVSDGLVSR
jgi:hypothetical protein